MLELLINIPLNFSSIPFEQHQRIINLNICFTTKLTHILLPELQKRDKSLLISLSSATSFLAAPLLSCYSASKSYNDVFARSLYQELKLKGVDSVSLVPQYVVSSMSQIKKSSLMIPTASKFAEDSLNKLDSGIGCDPFCPYLFHHIAEIFVHFLPFSMVNAKLFQLMLTTQARAIKKAKRDSASSASSSSATVASASASASASSSASKSPSSSSKKKKKT